MMFDIKSVKFAVAGAVTLFLSFSSPASAATCPDDGVVLTRTISVDPSSGCWAYGLGNINGEVAHDPILNSATTDGNTFVKGLSWTNIAGLILLDKSDEVGNVLEGVLSGNVGDSSKIGTITVGSVVGYESFILALKVGGGGLNPVWAAFVISGAGSYDFNVVSTKGGGISHANLYGVESEIVFQPIPIPGGIFLLLTGLVGLGALGRMRKHSRAA